MAIKFLNIHDVSKFLTGHKTKIRTNQIPEKYAGTIDECSKCVEKILTKAKQSKL